ncbi:MAG: dephospho-CoA kinase [Frankiales bacterium]|nr:dephospho-CoA kinase [Frankiales bacterium]
MLKVGLTGGIGSGKSTVSRQMSAYRGVVVVDADLIAREVVEPGTPGLAGVVEEFGPSVLREDGTLDRDALGAVVFGDDERRKALSAILHPLIGELSGQRWAEAEAGGATVLVHDVPLLVEAGLTNMYDEVVVVDVPVEVQAQRLVELRGMSESDARARIASQAAREARLAAATTVLDNSGTVADLTKQVERLASKWDLTPA